MSSYQARNWVLLAFLVAIYPTASSAESLTPVPTKPPVVISTQCSSTGCWVHYQDGTSKFVANK